MVRRRHPFSADLDNGVGQLDNAKAFNITADDAWTSCCATNGTTTILNEAGATITKSGAGTTTLGQGGNDFTNNGVVTTDGGVLHVGGGPSSGGTGNFDAGAGEINFTEGTFTLRGTSSEAGTLHITGATVRLVDTARWAALDTQVTNGTLDIDSTPASPNQTSDLSVDSGTFAGDGDVTVSGTFTWSGGAVEGAGTLLLDAGSVASIDSPTVHDLSRRIENRGAITWNDGTIRGRSDLGGVGNVDNFGNFVVATANNFGRVLRNGPLHQRGERDTHQAGSR